MPKRMAFLIFNFQFHKIILLGGKNTKNGRQSCSKCVATSNCQRFLISFDAITICFYETHLALTLKVGINCFFWATQFFRRFHAGVKVFMKWTPGLGICRVEAHAHTERSTLKCKKSSSGRIDGS